MSSLPIMLDPVFSTTAAPSVALEIVTEYLPDVDKLSLLISWKQGTTIEQINAKGVISVTDTVSSEISSN